jgi:hypothetical protein
MAISEADTRAKLIDPAIHARGWTEDLIRREETAGAIEIVGGKARKQAKGRTDYTLRVQVNAETQPVAVALIEAKAEDRPPTHGLEQVKGYASAGTRLHVPFVFSTNGHLYVEYDAFFAFVNGELLPHLKGLAEKPNAMPRQKVISQILSGVERVRVDTERNFLDVLDRVDGIRLASVNRGAHLEDGPQHFFTLSQVYEGLLLRMGEKGNDGGQFFTPREIIRAMVRAVNPRVGETVVALSQVLPLAVRGTCDAVAAA